MTQVEQRSLYQSVLDLIGTFLYKEGFPKVKYLPEGILTLIDQTSAYHEEGEELFPEIFITNEIEKVLETLPFIQRIKIGRNTISISEFEQVLKLCAPLSRNGWIIYINIESDYISYGLISTEISELSPSFKRQVLGDLSGNQSEYSIAYLQNVGNKSVLLKGSETEALVCLSLNSQVTFLGENLSRLCSSICKDIDNYQDITISYLEKIISEAARIGHGNLVGVVLDDADSIKKVKDRHPDGIYLEEPIDLQSYLSLSEDSKSRQDSTINRLYSCIVQDMLNHDGITLFTTTGKVIGYHIFVKPIENEGADVVGGARSRAFEVMKASNVLSACFYKSQDGNEKIWEAE